MLAVVAPLTFISLALDVETAPPFALALLELALVHRAAAGPHDAAYAVCDVEAVEGDCLAPIEPLPGSRRRPVGERQAGALAYLSPEGARGKQRVPALADEAVAGGYLAGRQER